jgi:hypothetical protein
MFKLTAKVQGTSEYDLVLALREVINKVESGLMGFRDGNEDGQYTFWIDEESEVA